MSNNRLWTPLKNISFAGMFSAQFLGAFNDNFFRTVIGILVTFGSIVAISSDSQAMLVYAGMAIFTLPFFIFSAMGGEIADKCNKASVIKCLKFFEVVIACLTAYFYYTQSIVGLLFTLFLMGTQSAFFGPIKLSIIPSLVDEKNLLAGNSLILTATYIAILLGIICGGTELVIQYGFILPVTMICVSIAGFASSLLIKPIPSLAPDTKVNLNFFSSTWNTMKECNKSTVVLLTILGISWCYLVASVLFSQMPSLIKGINGIPSLATFFIGLMAVGIGVGALTTNKICKGGVSPTSVPFTSIALTFALFDYTYTSSNLDVLAENSGFFDFFNSFNSYHFTFDLLAMSFLIGLFIVPLEAYLQKIIPDDYRSRIIGGKNIVNTLFMLVGSVLAIVCLNITTSVTVANVLTFLIIAIANTVVAILIFGLLPAPIIKMFSRKILKFFFNVRVEGLENYEAQKDKKTLIVANHTSFLDGILIWTFVDDEIYFAIDRKISNIWWIKFVLHIVNYFQVDNSNPLSVKDMIKKVNEGCKVLIFPEGRITTTGGLMKIYPGPAMVAARSGADILPICLEGSQYRFSSYYGAKLKRRPRTDIVIKILPVENLTEDIKEGEKEDSATKIYDLLARMKVTSSDIPNETLFSTLIRAINQLGGARIVLEDINRKPISLKKLFQASMIFGHWFKKKTDSEYMGFLLPNSVAAVISFMGIQACGRIPCMLNFSSGIASILSCTDTVKLKTVVTSREFIKQGGFSDLEKALIEHGITLLYLEDLKADIGFFDKARAFVESFCKVSSYKNLSSDRTNADETAVVLFTSGSEGLPKGVALSHRNIQTNRVQLKSVISFGLLDTIFNAMPMFHSFGLTAGTLLTILDGVRTFMYPSPLHYKQVPLLVYDTNATAIFGTDTFLKGYAKYAHPYDMYQIRFAVAGGEKLKDETQEMWNEKFGIRIFEGYGATETAPVIAVNTNMFYKKHTVGRLLPCIEARLEEIPGIENGGRLYVKGNNVMLGYYRASNPCVLERVTDGWYDTGDIVDIDEGGFVHILGRAKRFSKIGGEMVSLTAVEMALSELYPETPLAVVAIPDAKKGEALVLFIQKNDVTRKDIQAFFKEKSINELSVPSIIEYLAEIPLNGTGKIDYVKVNELAKSRFIKE